MSSITSVTWNSGGVNHTEVFALGYNNTVFMSKDGGSFVSEGGYLTAISAGLDSAGNPEVYGIGGNNAVWVDDNGAGWVSRGGYVTAISGSVDNTVFAIGGDNAVCDQPRRDELDRPGRRLRRRSAPVWTRPAIRRSSPSAATTPSSVQRQRGRLGQPGGYVTAISGSVNNTVFAIGGDNGV